MHNVYILAFGSVSMIGALALMAIIFFRLSEEAKAKFTVICTAFACGAMLTNAILNMVPEAVEHGNLGWILIGMFVSLLASVFSERTPNKKTCPVCLEDASESSTGSLPSAPGFFAKLRARVRGLFVDPDKHVHSMAGTIIYAHMFDNFNDGAGIAAQFLISIPHGIQTALAVVLHELGEEISYYFLLQKWGFTRLGAILINFMSALGALVGCGLVLAAVAWVAGFAEWTNGFCAGVFLYVALSGLVPEMRNEKDDKRKMVMVLFVAVGSALVYTLYHFFPGA
jgi:zinc and cadmium transporter